MVGIIIIFIKVLYIGSIYRPLMMYVCVTLTKKENNVYLRSGHILQLGVNLHQKGNNVYLRSGHILQLGVNTVCFL